MWVGESTCCTPAAEVRARPTRGGISWAGSSRVSGTLTPTSKPERCTTTGPPCSSAPDSTSHCSDQAPGAALAEHLPSTLLGVVRQALGSDLQEHFQHTRPL